MSEGLYDEDGIDGPFERRMRRAMREDAVAVQRLPTASRSSVGMETDCDHCGEKITDEHFYAGFVASRGHLKLHERCLAAMRGA